MTGYATEVGMPTVIEIVTEYLKAGGFDGLANGEIDIGGKDCFHGFGPSPEELRAAAA